MHTFGYHAESACRNFTKFDSSGKALRSAPNADLLAGVLIQGTPYVAIYNNADGAWYLQGFFGNPFNIPLAGGMDYWGTVVPNSAFAFPIGQAISRTTYATLFAIMGTTYGAGDGTTTFNLPDKGGRVSAMKEAAAARLTSTFFGGDSTAMGATGSSSEKSALSSTTQLPQFTPAGSITNGAITFPNASIASSGNGQVGAIVTNSSGPGGNNLTSSLNPSQASSTFTGTAIGSASPSSFRTVQPTIICNYIIRVL